MSGKQLSLEGCPLKTGKELRCGLAVINLNSGALNGLLWIHSGIEGVFSVAVPNSLRNRAVIGPDITSAGRLACIDSSSLSVRS
jgi:hypothetical protein